MMKKFRNIFLSLVLLITMFAACNKVFAFAQGETYHRYPTGDTCSYPNCAWYDNIVYKVDGNKPLQALGYKIWKHSGYRIADSKAYEMFCLDPAKQPYNNGNGRTTLTTVSTMSSNVPTDLALMYIMAQKEYSNYFSKSIAVRAMQTFSSYYNTDATDKAGLVKAYINAGTWWTLTGNSELNGKITNDDVKALLGINVDVNNLNDIAKIRAKYDTKLNAIKGYTSYMLNDGSLSGATRVSDVYVANQIYVNAVKYAAAYTNQRNPENKRKIEANGVKSQRKISTVCAENGTMTVTDVQVVDVTLFNYLKTKIANNLPDQYKIYFKVENVNGADNVIIKSVQYSMDGGKTYKDFTSDNINFAELINSNKQTVRFKVTLQGTVKKATKTFIPTFNLNVITYYKAYKEGALSGAYLVADSKSHPSYQRFLVGEGDIYALEDRGNADAPAKIKITWDDDCSEKITCEAALKKYANAVVLSCNKSKSCTLSNLREFNQLITSGGLANLDHGEIKCGISLQLCQNIEGQTYGDKAKCEKAIKDYGFMEDGHLAHCIQNKFNEYEISCQTYTCDEIAASKKQWTSEVSDLVVACKAATDPEKHNACLELKSRYNLVDAKEAQRFVPDATGEYIACGGTKNTCETFSGKKYQNYKFNSCDDAKKALSSSEGTKATCVEDVLICTATCNSLKATVKDMDRKYSFGEWAEGYFSGILTKYDNLEKRNPKESDKVGLNSESGEVVCNTCASYEGMTYSAAGYRSFAELKANVSDPEITFYENNQVVCKKTNCQMPPDKNNKAEWGRWIKDCCHFESAEKESIEYKCNTEKDQTYCQMYEDYCRICDTKFNIDSTCSDFSEGEFENDRRGSITGPEDIALCILDDSVQGRKNNSSYLLTKDSSVIPFDAAKQVGNPYCTVYCKEDYTLNIPSGRYVISGRYFTLGMNMNATKTCYSTNIDYDRFNNDFDYAKTLITNAADDKAKNEAWLYYKTVVNNINACAAGWSNDYAGWYKESADDKTAETELSPKVSYTYDEKEYIDLVGSKELNMVRRSNDVTVVDSFCTGNVDDSYNNCNTKPMGNTKTTREVDGYSCEVDTTGKLICSGKKEVVPTVNYAKKAITTTSLYTSGTYFKTKYSTGVVTKYENDDCPDFYKQSEEGKLDPKATCKYTLVETKLHNDLNNAGKVIVEGGLPVKLKNDAGVYNYYFSFNNIGEFYNKELTGRLIDTDPAKNADVNRNNNTINSNYPTDPNADNRHESSHPFKGSYVCSYIVNCPECKVQCVDDPENGFYCDLPDSCPGGNCSAKCDGEHCAFDSEHGTLYTVHQTSLLNLSSDDKNRTEVGFNWDDKNNVKAAETIKKITEAGESVYEEPEYSFTFTPGVISFVRDYNNNEGKNDGYLNDSLDCQLYSYKLKLIKKANGKVFNGTENVSVTDEMIANAEANDYQVCTSDLLSKLNDGQYKAQTHLDGREKIESYLNSEYCRQGGTMICALVGSIGPAWK